MKLKKIVTVFLISTLVIALLLATFIFVPTDSGTLKMGTATRIYYADNISRAHKKVIERFNIIYKDQIEVVAIDLPFTKFSTNERKELLARFLRSRSDRIDVFAVDQIWVPRFAKWSLPLQNYFSSAFTDNLLREASRTLYVNDTLFAVPLYLDIAVMYYRDDLIGKFQNAAQIRKKLDESVTWEEFIKLGSDPAVNSPYFLFQAAEYEGLVCIFTEMMRGLGREIVSGDSLQLQSPEAKKALQFLCDLVKKYKSSPYEVVNLKENQTYDKFLNEDYIFLRGWPGFSRDIPEEYKMRNSVKAVRVPHFSGNEKVSVFGGWNLMISQYSTRAYESAKFVEFFLSDEAQEIMYNEGNYLPATKSFYENHAADPRIVFYRDIMEQGVHRPFLERYTSISDILSFYLNKAIKGEMSADDALNTASQKIISGNMLAK